MQKLKKSVEVKSKANCSATTTIWSNFSHLACHFDITAVKIANLNMETTPTFQPIGLTPSHIYLF